MPFQELLTPIVLTAHKTLRSQTPEPLYRLITPEAHAGWERWLLVRLTQAGAKAAHWQFQVFRTVSSAFPVPRAESGEQSDAVYRAFVSQPETRLQRLFDEFPALQRLTDVLVANWLATVGQFLGRVAADVGELAQSFGHGRPPGSVATINAGLSDPHRSGRCVAKAVFGDETTVMYKPRSLAPEAHFARLLDWLNTQNPPHSFRAARSWDRGDYGWMEHIVAGACAGVEEVHAFYWRAGALLCLCSLADAVDMHLENLVASGPHPVLIDLETLWHPQEAVGNGVGASQDAILRTGLLPDAASAGGGYVWSALARVFPSGGTTSGWTSINRDDMAWTTRRNPRPGTTHLPEYAGQACLASNFVPDLVAGFRWVCGWLTGNRRARAGFAAWIQALAESPRRRVLRSSAQYQRILERLTSPQNLRARQVSCVVWRETGHFLPAEIQALDCLDVPYIMQPAPESVFRVADLEKKLSTKNFRKPGGSSNAPWLESPGVRLLPRITRLVEVYQGRMVQITS